VPPKSSPKDDYTWKYFMPNTEEIHRRVIAVVVKALNVAEDEIQPTSTLRGDMGAESIDFLDLVFPARTGVWHQDSK
jgi:hypothetical protein